MGMGVRLEATERRVRRKGRDVQWRNVAGVSGGDAWRRRRKAVVDGEE